MSFSFSDVEAAVALARDAATGQSFGERMSLVTAHLRRAIPHAMTMLTIVPLEDSLDQVRVWHQDLDPDVARDYATHYVKLDVSHEACRANLGRPILLSQVVAHDRFGKDEYTSDCLLRGEIRHILGGWLPLARGLALQLTFARPPGTEDFSEKELALANLVAPDLVRAAFGTILEERVAAARAAHESGSPTGVLILDLDGEVVHADSRALALCRDLDPLRGVRSDHLAVPVAALAALPDGAPSATLERTVPLRGGGWALATLTRSGTRIVCLLETLSPGSPFRARAVLESLALTPREREVAELALRGLANKQIARELDVAEITVKVHLSSVYRKASVASRAELAALVLGG
jgi:DNA-binding CsgD family transcriptional regulator